MRKRRSHEEFVYETSLINPNIEILGHFVNFKTKIKCRCKTCGYEWYPNLSSIFYNHSGCPICTNHKAYKGVNDMWTTNPELAKLLEDPEDGYKYSQNSNVKVNWKCPNCNHITLNKSIISINKNGLSCKACGDGISFPEKFFASVLNQLSVQYETQKTFAWLKYKRYDFYIPQINCICEINGPQHYLDGLQFGNSNITLSYEQSNDKLKEDTAKANGVNEYIIIDAKESDVNYIRNSICQSNIINYYNLDNINWTIAGEDALKSKVIEACKLWNYGDTVSEISNHLGVCVSTIHTYLKTGTTLNLCNYDPQKNAQIGRKKNNGINQRKSVTCTNTGEVFDSINDAARKYNIKSSGNIWSCCNGRRHYAGYSTELNECLKWKYYVA